MKQKIVNTLTMVLSKWIWIHYKEYTQLDTKRVRLSNQPSKMVKTEFKQCQKCKCMKNIKISNELVL